MLHNSARTLPLAEGNFEIGTTLGAAGLASPRRSEPMHELASIGWPRQIRTMKTRQTRLPKTSSPVRPLTPAQVRVSYADVLAEAKRIQPRFVPEPLLARTGVGLMRSSGVSELAAAKKSAGRGRR
jgi:hypothetical protein